MTNRRHPTEGPTLPLAASPGRRYPAQATDSDRLNGAGTDQRVHDGSSDPKSIGGLFHCKDKWQSDLLILLKANAWLGLRPPLKSSVGSAVRASRATAA